MVKVAKLFAGFIILTGFSFYNFFSGTNTFLTPENKSKIINDGPIIVQLTQAPAGKLGVADLWKATLTNTSQKETYKIYLFGTLTDKKTGLVATATTTEFDLKPGLKIIKGSDFPQQPEVSYPNPDPKYKDALVQTGSLPEGDYEYCLYAKLKSTNEELGSDCKDHSIIGSEFINLISPSDGEELDVENQVTFSWMDSKVKKNSTYTLKIVEIKDKQTPEAAFERNNAWFEQSNIMKTVFQYPKSGKPFEVGKNFAWGVKSGNTISEISSFKAIKKNPPTNCAGVQVNFIKVSDSPCCFKVSITSTIYGTQTYMTITSDNYDISSSTHIWNQNPQNITSPVRVINWGGVLSIGTIDLATICFKPNATGIYSIKYKLLDEGIYCVNDVTLNCNVTPDCCTGFLSNVTSPNPIISGYNVIVNNSFSTLRKFNKVTATVVEANATAICDIPAGNIPVVCGITLAELSDFTSAINYGEANFTSINPDGVLSANSRLFLKFSQFTNTCKWSVKLCIRWTFTDLDCKTCEKLICYTFDINPVPNKKDEPQEKETGFENNERKQEAGGKKSNLISPLKFYFDYMLQNNLRIKQNDPPIQVEVLQGSSSITSVSSGSIFTYTIKYTIPENMANPSITDILPPELGPIIIDDMQGDNNFEPESIDNSTAKFKLKSGKELNNIPGFPNGTPGLETNTTGTLSINVKFPTGTTPIGTIALNSATLSGTKFDGNNLVEASYLSNIYSMTANAENKFLFTKTWLGGNTLNGTSTYQIDIINPNNSDIGGLNINSPEVTDILPTGSVFISSSTTKFKNGTIDVSNSPVYNSSSNKVIWTFPSSLTVNNIAYTYSALITVKYNQPPFFPGQEVENKVELNGTNPNNIPIILKNSSKIILVKPNNKTVNFTNPNGNYEISFSNDKGTPVDNFTLEDPIPGQITLSSISYQNIGTSFNGPVNIFWQSPYPGTYSPANGNPRSLPFTNVGISILGISNPSSLKFNFGTVPAGFSGKIILNFTASAPPGPAIIVSNCANISYDYLGQHYILNPFCANFTIPGTDVTTIYSLSKFLEPAVPTSFSPGSTIRFKLSLSLMSGPPSAGTLAVTDILPSVLDPSQISNCSPTTPIISGNNLTFNVFPPLSISMPSFIIFDIKVKNDAAPGTYLNQCQLNGSPGNSVQFTINANTTLDATKEIKSTASNTFTNTGLSYQGEVFEYKVKLKNTFTTPVNNIKILDIFPYLNDTKVVNNNPRNSQWSPTLISEINTGIPGVITRYSTNSNICRNDLNLTGPSGCVNPVWMNFNDITNVTDIKAVLFEFPPTYILNPNQEFSFQWTMRVPNGAPANLKAYNSFGYVAQRTDNNQMLLAAESQVVSVEVKPAEPIIIGDFVFNDINQNGIQDAGESGINGVLVELQNSSGETVNDKFGNPVVPTMTANNYSNQPGYYQFSNLNPGTYRLKFTKPSSLYFTLKNQGTDFNKDSDVDPTTGITDVFTLVAGSTNYSFDAGLKSSSSVDCDFALSTPTIICVEDQEHKYSFTIPIIQNTSGLDGTINVTSNTGSIISFSPTNLLSGQTANISGILETTSLGQTPVEFTVTLNLSNGTSCQKNISSSIPCCCKFSVGTPIVECKPGYPGVYTISIPVSNQSSCSGSIVFTSSIGTLVSRPSSPPNYLNFELTGISSGIITITAVMTNSLDPLVNCSHTIDVTLPECCTCNFNVRAEKFDCQNIGSNTSEYDFVLMVENTTNCVGSITNVTSSSGTISLVPGNTEILPASTIPLYGSVSVSTGTPSVTLTLTMKMSDGSSCNKQITINLPCCCKLLINDPIINCYQSPPTKNFNPCEWYDVKQPVTNTSNCDGILKIINPNGNIIATSTMSAGATQTFSFLLANTSGQDMIIKFILTLSDGTICELPYTYHFPDCCVCDFNYLNPVINCVEGNPGEYTFQVDITNTANYTLSLEPTVSSSGTTTITSTWYQLPMGATMLLTGKISNPTGTNVGITITMKMPDNMTCQKILSFALPECPGNPPPDCCSDYQIEIKDNNKEYLGANTIEINNKIATTQTQITEFSATILSAELNYPTSNCGITFVYPHSEVMGTILSNSTFTNFLTPNLLTPTSREIIWYNTSGTTINNNILDLRIKFLTPQFYNNCGGVLKICLKYSFTDINCKRCEKIVCYEIPIQ